MIRVSIDAALVTDIDLRFSGAGKAFARFRAVSKERKRGNDGTWQDGDETFFSVVVFGKPAEMLAESNPAKGTRLLIEGVAKMESWENKDGETKTGLSVTANHVGLELLFAAYDKKGDQQAARSSGQRRDGWDTGGSGGDPWQTQGSMGGSFPEEPPF